MTGYLRNGYCEVPGSDFGNHGVAAEVTEEYTYTISPFLTSYTPLTI